jgi:hypothetical protein
MHGSSNDSASVTISTSTSSTRGYSNQETNLKALSMQMMFDEVLMGLKQTHN